MTAVTGSGLVVPDYAETRLAFRCWQFDDAALTLLSLNEPGPKGNWLAQAMAYPVGGWPRDRVLPGECAMVGKPFPKPKGQAAKGKKGVEGDEEAEEEARVHGRVPDPECTCGIYATTDLDVLNMYLQPGAPVVGIVELGGRIIPAAQGYRAEYARIAGVLLVDEQLTEPHPLLTELADAYNVPAIIPPPDDPGVSPEYYRSAVSGIGAEAERFLRLLRSPNPD